MKPISTILEEVRALDEKASKGPWESDRRYSRYEDRSWGAAILSPDNYLFESIPDGGLIETEGEESHDQQARDNAAFIAASRTLLPRLAKALEVAMRTLEEEECIYTLGMIQRILNGEGEDA